MTIDHGKKSYRVVNDDLVLFNDEYYLTVWRIPLEQAGAQPREELFNILYAFADADIEVEIDVSEEDRGVWYLQLLVPHVLTLPEAAQRRIARGGEALLAWLTEKGAGVAPEVLDGQDVYEYVRRYNPGLVQEA
ncbi:hypothetical protein [Brevibacillus dissolubilis]|uniref:hypothetical protein n=1 Tax=Brevibacillus dissolubilis TaxID=1844116 RepID=UPI001117436A|nr:hypothetical protein [Brevibacillus dissolubilis]